MVKFLPAKLHLLHLVQEVNLAPSVFFVVVLVVVVVVILGRCYHINVSKE